MQARDIDLEEGWSRHEFQKGLTPVSALPREDVKFMVGLGNRVQMKDFAEWTKAALFVQNIEDGGIFRSVKGDLILGPCFAWEHLPERLAAESVNKRYCKWLGIG
ncbi:hypothetical protein PG993_001744 [Apiospora rasikravindrae]|uniref:Uncharacterized protein n=1 Tax=Apiospora rasikravindrae TaxID=990691 RepID=A0ABR1UC89_9PEZI